MNQYTLKDLPKKTKLIVITETDSIESALTKIFSNHILSCPVQSKDGVLVGSISVIDITLFAINLCQTTQELAKYFGFPVSKPGLNSNFDQIQNNLIRDKDYEPLVSGIDHASFLTNYSRRNHLTVLPSATQLSTAATILTQNHRIAVGDETLENYVTQTDLVKFFQEKHIFDDIADKTVKDLELGSNQVVSITETDFVLEAFKKMVINKVSGVGVVNEEGKLVGQVSAHDIRSMKASGEMMDYLYKPYTEYKLILAKKFQVPLSPITVSSSTPLKEVVDTLLSNKIHRVFVVDDNQLTGVASFSDIIKTVLHKEKK